MGKKEVKRYYDPFWSFSNPRSRVKPFFRRIHNSSGFTLVELLVVVGIIGIMAVGLFSVIDPVGQLQKSRDAERKSDLKELQKALELYYQDYGIYPSQTSYKILNLNWGNPWGPYLPTLPQDPSSTRKYIYYTPSDGQSYWLYASLEKTDDPQLCPNLDVTNKECPSIGTNITGYTVKSCGTSNDKPCNFGLSSPNTTP